MKELLKKTNEELSFDISKKKDELEKFVQGLMKDKEKDTSKLKKIKKEIARMHTAINERKQDVKENI